MTSVRLGTVVTIVVENGTEPVVKCGLLSCDFSCPHLEACDHRPMLRDPRDRRQTDSHVSMIVSLSIRPVDVAFLTGYTKRSGTESSKQQLWYTERIESLTNTYYTNTHKQQ